LENRQEGNEVDLTRFPAPLWHRDDGGRFLGTGNIVVMRDPDTGWINCGTYRVQVHDEQTACIYISPGKHGRLIRDKYWKRGEGPFGEWTGYYASGEKDEPIIRVRSIIHRDDPIVLGCLPGKPPNDNTFFRSPLRAALIWDELERSGVPGIKGVWSHEAGGG